jgi:hypothetical protein
MPTSRPSGRGVPDHQPDLERKAETSGQAANGRAFCRSKTDFRPAIRRLPRVLPGFLSLPPQFPLVPPNRNAYKVSRDDLRKIGDETGQGLSGSPCYAAVHLNRNGKPALGKIHHFGHITGKEAAVPIGNPEGGRPDDHTQSILMDLKRSLISIPGTPMNDHHRRGCRRQRGDYSRLCSPIRISSGWRSPAFLSHHWINDNCVDPWFCAMRR